MTPRRAGRRRPRVAVLGGTFDHLHAGHRAMLSTAFDGAQEVGIGVTTDDFLADHPKPSAGRIQPFRTRWRNLERYLREHYPRRRFWLAPLSDGFGRSVEPGVDLLVVSADTHAGGRRVNAERGRRGLPPLPILRVPLVRGDDGFPVSSRRIRAGAIDPQGHRLTPLRVRVLLAGRGREPGGVRAWVLEAFPRAECRVRLERTSRSLSVEEATRWAAGRLDLDGMRIALTRLRAGRWSALLAFPGAREVRRRALSEREDGRLPPLRALLR